MFETFDDILSIEEVAEALKIGTSQAYKIVRSGALKGYKEAIKEKQKVIVEKKELSEDDAIMLSRKLNEIKKGDMIKVIYYLDSQYICIEGMLSKINIDERYLMIVKTKIPFIDIKSLDILEM